MTTVPAPANGYWLLAANAVDGKTIGYLYKPAIQDHRVNTR